MLVHMVAFKYRTDVDPAARDDAQPGRELQVSELLTDADVGSEVRVTLRGGATFYGMVVTVAPVVTLHTRAKNTTPPSARDDSIIPDEIAAVTRWKKDS